MPFEHVLEPAVGLRPGAEVREHVLEDSPVAERVDLLRQIADRSTLRSRSISPAVEVILVPSRTLNSVDLPAPFLPSRPIRSPRTIETSMPSYRTCRPKFLRALVNRIIGIKACEWRDGAGCSARSVRV